MHAQIWSIFTIGGLAKVLFGSRMRSKKRMFLKLNPNPNPKPKP